MKLSDLKTSDLAMLIRPQGTNSFKTMKIAKILLVERQDATTGDLQFLAKFSKDLASKARRALLEHQGLSLQNLVFLSWQSYKDRISPKAQWMLLKHQDVPENELLQLSVNGYTKKIKTEAEKTLLSCKEISTSGLIEFATFCKRSRSAVIKAQTALLYHPKSSLREFYYLSRDGLTEEIRRKATETLSSPYQKFLISLTS